MTEFFPPILEHFCPLFVRIAQMDLTLPRLGLILPRIPSPTPVLYPAVTNPFWGNIHTQNTPNPTPKHPFSWKVGNMDYCLGILDPNWAKCLKSGPLFSRSGHQKNDSYHLIHTFLPTVFMTEPGTQCWLSNSTERGLAGFFSTWQTTFFGIFPLPASSSQAIACSVIACQFTWVRGGLD